MKKTKITFFIQDFQGGGAERMMINLANGFAENGDRDVDLVIVRNAGPYKTLVNTKVNIIQLESKKVLFSIFSLSKYLKKEQPVALFSTLKHVNIAAILAKKVSRSSTKIIIREACHLLTTGNKQILQKLAYKLVPYFYKQADEIVAVSKGVAESIHVYCGIPMNRINILPNPTITNEIQVKARELPEHVFFKDKKTKVILGVGRLSKQKDFESLIKAFSIVKENSKDDIKLIIIGEGEKRAELEKLIDDPSLSNYVSLPGFVENPYSYMSNAKLFVLSSLFEGSPNALVEAMACGTNVVATNCPSGPSEILENGKYGRLVPVENIKELAKAISDALDEHDDASIIDSLIEKSKYYHVSTSVDKYGALINDK